MVIIPPVASPRFTFNGTTPSFIPATPTRTPFAQITRPFISDPRINLREFRVYTALLTFPPDEATGERWPSRETIGRMTGLPPKVVSRTTSRLQDLGWLVKFGDGGRSRTARYIVFDQAQPPGVILNFHTANRTPDTAQEGLPLNAPQGAPVDSVNPPQIDPVSPPTRGQNGEGQEVDYLDAVDKREPATEPARPEPAAASVPPLSVPLRNPKTEAPENVPEAWIDQAALMRPELPTETIRASAEKFLDHNRAKGTVLADWLPAWRNWIRRERAPRATQTASTATQPANRYAHLDAKETPVSAAVRAATERSEQNRIATLIERGINPATGLPAARSQATTSASASTVSNPNPSINDQADQSYAARLAALEARIAARKAREAAEEGRG